MNQKDLDPTASPLAAFGTQLRRSRRAKNLTQGELGKLMNYSDTLISYVERAERNPPRHFAVRADQVLETGGTLELMWWHLSRDSLTDGFPEFAKLEAKAVEMRLFEVTLVPGILQTEAYARALVRTSIDYGNTTPAQAEERIAFRMARQQVLQRDPALHLFAVLDESCLRRVVAEPQVMAAQLTHLLRLAQKPNIVLQVAPFARATRMPFSRSIRLLNLPGHRRIGYTETPQRGSLERDPEKVTAWRRDYDRLQVEALAQADSLEMIRTVREDYLHDHRCHDERHLAQEQLQQRRRRLHRGRIRIARPRPRP
ncbi:helix-turn-helix transcriptional regulator [Kitasatospora nipponensis]|uniref:Helix-turn-helix transcriptional regulator n=1 Tax=Kitasatospora nipponensis TaxID=258049 RepID=A0ABN1WC14_9ACTN